jgi:hypothetical protein
MTAGQFLKYTWTPPLYKRGVAQEIKEANNMDKDQYKIPEIKDKMTTTDTIMMIGLIVG